VSRDPGGKACHCGQRFLQSPENCESFLWWLHKVKSLRGVSHIKIRLQRATTAFRYKQEITLATQGISKKCIYFNPIMGKGEITSLEAKECCPNSLDHRSRKLQAEIEFTFTLVLSEEVLDNRSE
jgi:hypothetical protein